MRRFDCDHTLLHDDERDDLRPVGVATPGFNRHREPRPVALRLPLGLFAPTPAPYCIA
jgi:hypothetical protein